MRYRVIKSILALLVLIALCAGCKKNNTSPSPVIGQWRLLNTSDTPAYVLISQDMTITTLTGSSTGAHTYNKSAYQLESNTILISSRLYQYSKSGDTLKLLQDLTNQNSSSNMILVPTTNAPTLDTWLPSAVYGTSLPWPDLQMDALTMLGNNLWTSYQYDAMVRSYNTGSSQYIGNIPTTNNVSGIEAVGGDLWMYDETLRKLIKVDPVTKAVTFTSPAVPNGYGNPASLAYDGMNSIWCQSYSKVDVYNIATNSFNSYQMPDNYRDLAFGGGYLFAIDYSNIYKIDPATLKVLKTYRLATGDGSEVLASAGGNDFWIYIQDALQAPGRFQKITLN